MARRALTALVAAAAGPSLGLADGQNCFVLLDKPLDAPPFAAEEVAAMVKHFKANINVNGTGAIIASPGSVPALDGMNVPGGYQFHWMRDGALSMATLVRLATTPGSDGNVAVPGLEEITQHYLRDSLLSYAMWVNRMHDTQNGATDSDFVEPKWEIPTGKPYQGGWCRPQTDGPALRARTLMMAAKVMPQGEELFWKLAKLDLDWLSKGNGGSVHLTSCDLWEETRDPNFLWNRAMMRAALLEGHAFAADREEQDKASAYLSTADSVVGDPFGDHVMSFLQGGYATECPTSGESFSCRHYNKLIEGAVILSFVHASPARTSVYNTSTANKPPQPTSLVVARTVLAANKLFCGLYPVNQEDSKNSVPGVLYGRYGADQYGGGNPWVLITAALASVFYQAAQAIASGDMLGLEERWVWAEALGVSATTFEGSASEFVAAGDSVLVRLKSHILPEDNWHLFEQMKKSSGQQWNAQDLTWSYAEVLSALLERSQVAGSQAEKLHLV